MSFEDKWGNFGSRFVLVVQLERLAVAKLQQNREECNTESEIDAAGRRLLTYSDSIASGTDLQLLAEQTTRPIPQATEAPFRLYEVK
jgi:hypothetical protein